MDESILAFVRSVIIGNCRVINTPRFIFLCGGLTEKSGPFLSARDYFNRWIVAQKPVLASRVRLAETINDWFDHDTFTDLLELEVFLADSSDLTLLFVESPGAIAELGAFAASEHLRPKTLAILNSAHPLKRTFIADGPVRRIKSVDSGLVRYWEWDSKRINDPDTLSAFDEMSRELARLLVRRNKSATKEQKFDIKSHGHTMFLISDLVDIIGITFDTELIACLSEWGYKIDRKTLHKYLSLLEHLKLIKRTQHSAQVYYLSRASSPFLRYDFLAGTVERDRDRIKLSLRRELSIRDERRMNIYRRDLVNRSRRGH